jgi:hypothetical protein
LVASNFYFQNCLLSVLAWANGKAEIWEHSYNIHLKVTCIIFCFTKSWPFINHAQAKTLNKTTTLKHIITFSNLKTYINLKSIH